MTGKQAWAVILAGGDGSRLRPLTQFIAGEDRPKQFCRLFGSETLLGLTRSRLASAISPARTVFSVVKAHGRFYTDQLRDVAPSRYSCTSRGGWGGYGLGNVSYYLDSNRNFHVGTTVPFIAASTNEAAVGDVPALKTTDHWANVLFDFGFSF